MVSFPYLYMKTPIQLEFIDEEDCSFEVQTYIGISVYIKQTSQDAIPLGWHLEV